MGDSGETVGRPLPTISARLVVVRLRGTSTSMDTVSGNIARRFDKPNAVGVCSSLGRNDEHRFRWMS